MKDILPPYIHSLLFRQNKLAISTCCRRILCENLHQRHPHILLKLMEYSFHLFGILVFQLVSNPRDKSPFTLTWLMPPALLNPILLFNHKIEAGLSLCQKIFQQDYWMLFWTDLMHVQNWMYYPNIICHQHLTYAPLWLFFHPRYWQAEP